jgi:predicted phosphodiesterase
MDMIRILVKQFGIDVVVDTGDISDHGTSVEDPYLDEITRVSAPYVFVRGNHDSMHTEDVIRSKSNAIVLDNSDIVTIAGLTFSGVGDPRFTPDKSTPKIAEKAVVDLVAAMAATIKGKGVDITLVHDATATAPLKDRVALILSGHTHKRETVRLSDVTTLMVSGSTGGGGLRALSGDKPAPLEATIIHISKTTRRVVAWDEITMGGLGSATVQVTRHLPETLHAAR